MDDIEKEIDEELGKLNLDPFDNVSEESEDENYTAVDATVSGICISTCFRPTIKMKTICSYIVQV